MSPKYMQDEPYVSAFSATTLVQIPSSLPQVSTTVFRHLILYSTFLGAGMSILFRM